LPADRDTAIANNKARDGATHNKLLDIGIHDDTPLMHLPGANWPDFWVPGSAHAVLLGLCRDADVLFKRDNKEKLSDGNEYRLRNPPNFRGASMQDRSLAEIRKLRRTSLYKRGLENVAACDSTVSFPSASDPCGLMLLTVLGVFPIVTELA
jgi:hypothetical protein